MTWIKETPVSAGTVPCLICGCGAHASLSMDRLLAVGFGDVSVTKDGELIWSETQVPKDGEFWEGKDAEAAALSDPDHDWRVTFIAPLYDSEYQRQGDGHWPLIRKGLGFA